jgi:hypothetical protein
MTVLSPHIVFLHPRLRDMALNLVLPVLARHALPHSGQDIAGLVSPGPAMSAYRVVAEGCHELGPVYAATSE